MVNSRRSPALTLQPGWPRDADGDAGAQARRRVRASQPRRRGVNGAYTGIDPYFDDLFLMAAERRYLSVRTPRLHRRVDQNRSAAGTLGQPDDGRRRCRGARRRALHRHRTGLPPRREVPTALRRGRRRRTRAAASCRPICRGAKTTTRWPFADSLRRRIVNEAPTRAEVCAVACADLFRDAGEIMISPMTTIASVGARLARLTFSPDILLTDGEARLIADTPALGKTRRDRRLDAVRPGFRDPVLG